MSYKRPRATTVNISSKRPLLEFEVADDKKVPPVIPTAAQEKCNMQQLDYFLESQDGTRVYLDSLKSETCKHVQQMKTNKKSDIIIDQNAEAELRLHPKLLQFHENVRPPYWGTWRKKSSKIHARNPFGQDEMINYDFDSDDEWNEGGPGENLSVIDNEDGATKNDSEVENDVIVLSDEEENIEDEVKDGTRVYLDSLKSETCKHVQQMKTNKKSDIIIDQNAEAELRLHPKLLQFHENVRPPYWGTWRKKSSKIHARNPFGQDEMINYDFDSDDEWNEGGPGENLSVIDNEDGATKNDSEVENDVIVLSDEEENIEDEVKDGTRVYLDSLKSETCKHVQQMKRNKKSDIIIDQNAEAELRLRPKLLQFHENVRPPYWGTWRKKSSKIHARNPFGQDEMINYDFDSDDEWNEGGPGENLSVIDNEDGAIKNDSEVENDVIVLSDEEENIEDEVKISSKRPLLAFEVADDKKVPPVVPTAAQEKCNMQQLD